LTGYPAVTNEDNRLISTTGKQKFEPGICKSHAIHIKSMRAQKTLVAISSYRAGRELDTE